MNIAVVIPVYEREESLRRAVLSVIDQTSPVTEIIVVDDGSKKSKASAVLADISDERLQLLHQPHLGVSTARNLGIKASDSPWVAFLDSDDHWLPDKNSKHVQYHLDQPDCLISQTDEIWIRNGRQINPKEYHSKPAGDIFLRSLERCLISPSAVMINQDLFDQVGLFDPTLPACEDYDLWLRITASHKVGLVPEALVVKTGGHDDQLSQKHWGMDRFRVQALRKLIDGHDLSEEQQWAATQTLATKLSILETGARKRGQTAQAQLYSQLREAYTELSSENLTLFPDDAL